MSTAPKLEEDRFRLLFEHSSDAHFIFDDRGITDCNDAAIEMLNCTCRDHVLRSHPAELSPPFQPDGKSSLQKSVEMDRIAREKGFHRFEWVHRRVTGEDFPVQVTLNAVTIGGRPSLIAVWHDLTEIKEKENKLLAANDKMHRDLEAAALIQRSMLPVATPLIKGLRASWAYKPCDELGGDILNIFPLDEKHTGLYVLDVMGHGLPASLLSVAASHILSPHSEASFVRSIRGTELARPARVAERLNRHFSANPDFNQYFTLLYGVLDVDAREFCYVCAGHPLPFVVSRDGSVRSAKGSGYPIGVTANPEYSEMRLKLKPGDRLYLYSDGITEAKSAANGLFGEERFMQLLSGTCNVALPDSLDAVMREVDGWCGGNPDDDVTLLACELAG